jgi:hypothetical protein
MSAQGVSLEEIARLAGCSSTTMTELVYRKGLRPVAPRSAEVMSNPFEVESKLTDSLFGS